MKKKKQYKRRQVEDDIIANYSEKLNPAKIEDTECKRKFGYFWEQEWDKLEGEINQFTYKFWKEAWFQGITEGKKLIIDEEMDFLQIILDALRFHDISHTFGNNAGMKNIMNKIKEELNRLSQLLIRRIMKFAGKSLI